MSPLLPFLAVSSIALSTFFTLSLPLGYSSLSLSFLFLPLASPSPFPNVTDALAVAPALCAPARVARAMASNFHANVNVAGSVVSGTFTVCGSTLLAVWGALPKRRGNAGSDSELSYHLNTVIEVRWVCVFACSLSLSHSLCAICPTLPPHVRPRISCLLSFLTFSSLLLPPLLRLRLRFLLLFILSSSSLYFLSSSSLSPPLLLLGVFLLGRLLLCFRLG